jgi:hypothetical protein
MLMVTISQPPPLPLPGAWDYYQTQREVSHILTAMGMPAVLRRGAGPATSDRWCQAFLYRWRPNIQMGGLVAPTERLVLISARGLSIPPDVQDALVTFLQPLGDVPVEDENLRIIEPPAPIKPAGVLLCWKARVRR